MENEYLLEKLAEQFTEDELEQILEEAAEEAELAENLDLAEDEQEKVASAYYELGQVMALGFQNQLEGLEFEKEAGVRRRLAVAAAAAKRLGSGAYNALASRAKGVGNSLNRIRAEYLAERPLSEASAKALGLKMKSRTNAIHGIVGRRIGKRNLKDLGRVARGAGYLGAAGAAGVATGAAAKKLMGEKRSFNEGYYAALEELGLLE